MIAIAAIQAHRFGVSKHQIHLGATERIITLRVFHPFLDKANASPFVTVGTTCNDYGINQTHTHNIENPHLPFTYFKFDQGFFKLETCCII
jgi:hypothetical protein